MTEILQQISAVLEENGIPHYLDEQKKNYSGDYYGIYKNRRCLYLLHNIDKNFIAVITPRSLSPEEIRATYGIECERDQEDTHYKSITHYVLRIHLRNGLLTGQFRIADKKHFFIKITRMR